MGWGHLMTFPYGVYLLLVNLHLSKSHQWVKQGVKGEERWHRQDGGHTVGKRGGPSVLGMGHLGEILDGSIDWW